MINSPSKKVQQPAINCDNDEDDDILMIKNNNNDYDNAISGLPPKSKKRK